MATKISELACDRQEEERQEPQNVTEYTGLTENGNDGESQELFYPTQDEHLGLEEMECEAPKNPFLAAKYKKENISANFRSPASPDISKARNPFKKSVFPQQR